MPIYIFHLSNALSILQKNTNNLPFMILSNPKLFACVQQHNVLCLPPRAPSFFSKEIKIMGSRYFVHICSPCVTPDQKRLFSSPPVVPGRGRVCDRYSISLFIFWPFYWRAKDSHGHFFSRQWSPSFFTKRRR